ncbi:MAG: trigger factor [Maritimibacter sp.]|nr:trigger factor [Maritimibacter sp.]
MPKLTDFEGRWRIARRIEDHWMGTTGLFEGVARFTPDGQGLNGQGLSYHEVGELKLPQEVPLTASRRFLWRGDEDGIEVLYEDGAPFHRIAGRARVVQAWHACGQDDYEVSYNFTRWPDWRMIWRVRGPRKDYTSISDYSRLAGA